MQVSLKPIGTFLVQFIGIEEVLDNTEKLRLQFASLSRVSGSGRRVSPEEAKDFFGANFKSKMSREEVKKIKHILKVDGVYLIEAAIDSYAIKSEGGLQQGVWFEILDIQPSEISSISNSIPAS
jgi:hypothetical protein